MLPLFFIHLPKAAGSSVVSCMALNNGSEGLTYFEWPTDGQWHAEKESLIKTGLGTGHQSYGIHNALKMPLNYCTVFREPLSRHISHFFYALSQKNGEVLSGASVSLEEALVYRKKISLNEWVGKSLYARNHMCMMLSGSSHVGPEQFEIAKKNLANHVTTFGFSSDLSHFLLQLCANSKMDLPFSVRTNETINASRPDEHPLSEEAKQRFYELNQFDSMLYEYAQKLQSERAHDPLEQAAIDCVRKVQKSIDEIKSPNFNSSFLFKTDDKFLTEIKNRIHEHDIMAIQTYLSHAREKAPIAKDLHTGFVDNISGNSVCGWAINLSSPDEKVIIEVISEGKVVATGENNLPRHDLLAAGYPTSKAGFSIALPDNFHQE